jgi:hypothetical protein
LIERLLWARIAWFVALPNAPQRRRRVGSALAATAAVDRRRPLEPFGPIGQLIVGWRLDTPTLLGGVPRLTFRSPRRPTLLPIVVGAEILAS